LHEQHGNGKRRRRSLHSSLNVTHRPIDLLKPDPGNARARSKKQIRQLARSIETFGFNVPVLVDADLKVIAGHGRLQAARQLGFAEVPTISLEHLTPEHAKASAIADNRLAEIAEWNDRRLVEQLRGLTDLNLDFDLEVTGFE
jgi:ParB-like chromosome segregation protein Spo0J